MTATSRRGIDAALAQAREALDRLTPREAYEAARQGAVLVDIRPELNRQTEGAIPGALVIDRNVLEWRLDPTSEARLPLADYDLQVVVICNEGYASSLAAASLQGIGLHRAADLAGGYRSWRSAGLPTTLPGNRPA
jgi:rhodanese-related sulfurtransferase